jgi:hypothetical protein
MTPHNNWTTRDLFELASLDALGLLSEDERRSFEDAFAQASPHVQEQLRDQQSRMAEIDAILPRVEPPAGLRARVLAAVHAAIEALPGRSAAGRTHGAGRTPRLLPSRGVPAIWRGLAIGAAAAAVAFGVVTLQVFRQNQELNEAYSSSKMTDMLLKEFGPRFEKSLLSPSTRFVQFEGTKSDRDAGLAVLLLDENARTGQFFCKNLPQSDGNYPLVLTGPNGEILGDAVVAFHYNGSGIAYRDLSGIELGAGKSLALMAPGAPGTAPVTVLRSTTH